MKPCTTLFILLIALFLTACDPHEPGVERTPVDIATASPSLAPVMTSTRAPEANTTPTGVMTSVPTMAPTLTAAAMLHTPTTPRVTPAAPNNEPIIHSFVASPTKPVPGEPVTLSWSVSAEKAALRRALSDGQFWDPDWTPIPISGSLVITYDSDEPVTYLLRAESGQESATANLKITFVCRESWFFSNPSDYCPSVLPTYAKMVVQHFEHGLMIWAERNDQIRVLYGIDKGSMESRPNTWQTGMSESDPTIIPPSGYYQPVRGFGKLWRENQDIRNRLGWAIEAEFAIDHAAEQNAFFGDPNGTVYLLTESSEWRIWTAPTP